MKLLENNKEKLRYYSDINYFKIFDLIKGNSVHDYFTKDNVRIKFVKPS